MLKKITVIYHFTPIRMAIKKQKIISVGKDVEKLEPLYIAGGNVKWSGHCGKQHKFLKIKYRITIRCTNSISGYILKRIEIGDANFCTAMYKQHYSRQPKGRNSLSVP